MMTEVEAGRVSTTVTEDLSRISRDFADSATLFCCLEFLGVQLIGVADGVDTTQTGALLSFGVKSLRSAQYLADLSCKTHRGLEGRFLAGMAAGNVPYGYRTEKTDGGSVISIEPTEAARVREIFFRSTATVSHSQESRWP